LRNLKKIPGTLKSLSLINPNKSDYETINLYFQDEARFGLKTNVGRCLTAKV